MARKIIILERTDPASPRFNFAFWLDVPAARQAFYADADLGSAVKDATIQELTALRAGTILEQVGSTTEAPGATQVKILAGLVEGFNAAQAALTAETTWQRYGSFWDGTTWTAKGN